MGDLATWERLQVALGKALLRTMVLFLAAARTYGFAAIMEHPAEPVGFSSAPALWKLPELRTLAAAEGVQKVLVDQCCLGAPWRKPTCLLAVGVPELETLVRTLPGGSGLSRLFASSAAASARRLLRAYCGVAPA